MIEQPAHRPATAADYRLQALENLTIWLPDMMREAIAAGAKAITGRLFRNCVLQGPAVVLVVGKVEFDGCDFGYAKGDMRNLLLRPLTSQVIGAIPFAQCRFEDCLFVGTSYTGPESFLQEMMKVRAAPSREGPS